MQNFQIELDNSVSKAKITLLIAQKESFELSVTFGNYPQRPIIFLTPKVINLFSSLEKEFYQKLPSYNNWDSSSPKRISELIQEIKLVLKNKFESN